VKTKPKKRKDILRNYVGSLLGALIVFLNPWKFIKRQLMNSYANTIGVYKLLTLKIHNYKGPKNTKKLVLGAIFSYFLK